MLRLLLIMLAVWILAFSSAAQVSITPQVPPAGVLLKSQLWNLALVYTGNNTIYTRINLTITDVATNQPVISATSGTLILSKGTKQLQAQDVAPIQYQYPSASIADRNPDGFLPAGEYEACYTVMLNDEVNNTPLAEDCINFEVLPLSPPVLNTPADEDTVETKLPQFTWLPPTPINLFTNISYRITVVEVKQGQSPPDAIQQNLPLYGNQNISSVFLNYPSSGITLDTGKQYAWQITALNNMQPAGQSEVWTFYIGSKNMFPPAGGNSYILLNNSGAGRGVYSVDNANIGIKYYSFDKEHTAEIKFVDATGKLVKSVTEKMKYGDNYLRYTLTGVFKKGQLYFIQVQDLHNNKYSASFSIK